MRIVWKAYGGGGGGMGAHRYSVPPISRIPDISPTSSPMSASSIRLYRIVDLVSSPIGRWHR